MGASKINPTTVTVAGRGRFTAERLAQAEADDGLCFAVSIERLRGWPVHITRVGDQIVRFQAEDSGNQVYDPQGIFTAARFSGSVIKPLLQTYNDWPDDVFQNGHLRIGTKCIGEEGLQELGIAVDELAVQQISALILSNSAYLNLVPDRPRPRLSAKTLSRYSWNGCVVYAEALSRVTGLPAVTMVAEQVATGIEMTDGRFHALVVHPDGIVEDVWGKQPIDGVARRYGMTRWRLDADAHRTMIEKAIRVRPNAAADIADAEALIREAYGSTPSKRS